MEYLNDSLRHRIGIESIIIVIWFTCWFWRFFRDWRNGQNGATSALWAFFGIMAIERAVLIFALFYMASPWISAISTGAIFQVWELVVIGVIVSLFVLQWRFTGGQNKNNS